MTTESPIVDEVRARAERISARFGHDMHRYCEHLRQKQRETRLRLRVVSQPTVARETSHGEEASGTVTTRG